MFACLPFAKPCGKQIDHIDRRHAKLDQVPDEVLRSFRTLEECRLDANQIKELPKNFFRLERIRYLTLSDNDLTRIPPGLGNFSQLVELDISRNDISEIPSSIKFCDSLQSIDISNNPLQSLPSGFCQLRNLKVLCMNDISITELPGDIGNLHMLEKCEARDNCLKTLPNSFAQLVRLEFLDLGANEFHALPSVLGQLPNLSELWMDDNQLKSLPPELGNMKLLQQLDLSENLIDVLPEEIAGLTSLSDFNLSQNSLNCLPTGLGELKKLSVLKLNQNQLLTLNPAIGGCTSLQELYLTENFLSALPPTIGSLESMFLLNVDQNQLTELPPQIGQCTSLNILSLRENLLHRLPNEIGNCSRLRVLDVSGNRLERLPLNLARCPLSALWLSQNQSQPIVTLQRDVDELTNEEFLTCYLLPQDQLDAQTDLDPSLSPSELASFPGGPPAVGPLNLNDPDTIAAEANYAYEPALPRSQPSSVSAAFPLGQAKHAQAESLASSTPTSLIVSPSVSPNGAGAGLSETMVNPANYPHSSISPRVSLTNQVEDVESGSSRVHFISGAKEDEAKEKSSTKGFPKTRHPRFARKSTDYLVNSRDDSSDVQSNDQSSLEESRTSVPQSPMDPKVLITASTDSRGIDNNPTNEAHPITNSSASNLPTTFGPWCQMNESVPSSPTAQYRLKHRVSPSASPEDDEVCHGQHVVPFCQVHTETIDEEKSNEAVNSITPHVKPRKKAFHLYTTPSLVVSNVPNPHPVSSSDSSTFETRVPASNLPVSEDSQHRLDINPVADEDAYSSGGEEICVISRRVGFTADVEDNEEKSNQKLIRRDTPHYTKRARIQSKTADGVDSEEAVLKILEKYRASTTPNQLLSDLPNSEAPGTMKVLSASTTIGSSNIPGSITNLDSQIQKVIIHIHRQPGSGLGLSIAGGVGSIPFQGTDHGIFVSRLNPAGLAYASGLRLHDKLLEVNGISLVDVEHQVAVSALRSQTNDFRILVSRSQSVTEDQCGKAPGQPSPNSVVGTVTRNLTMSTTNQEEMAFSHLKCTIQRDISGLGFSISGGRGLSLMSSDRDRIIISKISDGGAASKCNLCVGDQIIKINGIDVQDARHDQVIALLAGAGTLVELEVIRQAPTPGDTQNKTQLANGYLTSKNSDALSCSQHLSSPCINYDRRTKESWLENTNAHKVTHLARRMTPNCPTYMRHENGLVVETVTIRLDGGPLGLAIYGGSDINCQPFSSNEPGIFISRISNDGAAQNSGLRVGDRILRVNDKDLRHATHDEAVEALIEPTSELHLEVRHDPAPPGLRRLTITRQRGERFGLRISGGVPSMRSDNIMSPNGSVGHCLSSFSNDGSILVSWVSPDGAVGRDGRLKPGNRLLEVNGFWMMGSTLEDALAVFRKADDTLNLIICDGPLSHFAFQFPDDRLKVQETCPKCTGVGSTSLSVDSAHTGFSVDHGDEPLSDSLPTPITLCSGDGTVRISSSPFNSVIPPERAVGAESIPQRSTRQEDEVKNSR